MEKYSDAITLVDNALRDKEAWPDDSTKLDEQLNLLHIAAQSVGMDVPLSRLPLVAATLNATDINGTAKLYPFPDDVFELRGDLGIHHFVFDGVPYFPFQSVAYNSFIASSENGIQTANILFTVDMEGRQAFAMNVTNMEIKYTKDFAAPADATADFPLNEKDRQRAVHLVAYHISGLTARDSAGAQFNALLANEYGDNQ